MGYLLMSTLLFLVAYSAANLLAGIHVFNLPMTLLGILCFSGFIIYDTWRLVSVLKPDAYIEGAISLYLDLLNSAQIVYHEHQRVSRCCLSRGLSLCSASLFLCVTWERGRHDMYVRTCHAASG